MTSAPAIAARSRLPNTPEGVMQRIATWFALSFVLLAPRALAAPAAPSGAGHVIQSHGVKLWYEVRGAAGGTPLVVVNGGPGFSHDYELCSDAWDVIGRSRPVVMWDQRGNGRSGPLARGASCTLLDQVDDLDAVRAALGRERIDLIGHSWGGYLVMAYTARHPEHVAHLLICDSAAPKWTDTEFMFKNFFPESVERQAVYDARDGLGDSLAMGSSLREYFGMLFVSIAKRDEFLGRLSAYRYNRAVNETLNTDLGRRDLWAALPGFTCPTLVMTGRYDVNVAPSTAWRIHRSIPGSRFVVFEQSGHLPFYEEPEAFARTVEDFLTAR
jgi:proline iminopeptidase